MTRYLAAIAAGLVALLSVATEGRAAGDPTPIAFTFGGIEILGSGPDALTVGAGAFNVILDNGEQNTTAEVRLEYRSGRKWRAVGPLLGALVTSEGGAFGYAALYADLRTVERWVVTPAVGVGVYEEGDDIDLGGVFQFHLAVGIAYRFDRGARLGLELAHISNAGLHDRNPGVESLNLFYAIPLDGRF